MSLPSFHMFHDVALMGGVSVVISAGTAPLPPCARHPAFCTLPSAMSATHAAASSPPLFSAAAEARYAEARLRQRVWGNREPVLTTTLKELPPGFSRTDHLSLRIPQLTEKGFPPLPLRVIIQSKHSTDLGKQRASLFKRPHGPPDDGAETEGGAVKKSKVNIDGGEWREGIGCCEFVGSSPEVDAEESENAMPAAQGEQAATAPQEDPQEGKVTPAQEAATAEYHDEEWPWLSAPRRRGLT